MKEKKPPCFGDFKKVEASKCTGCKFVLSCYVEWGRREKMRRAEDHRSAPKNMKLFLREKKPFQRAFSARAIERLEHIPQIANTKCSYLTLVRNVVPRL